MKIIKKITALLTAAVIMLCCMCTYAFADSNAANEARDSVVWIYTTDGYSAWSGTGFAVGEKGQPVEYIVTNAHVAADDYGRYSSNLIQVVFSAKSNKVVQADVVYFNLDKDICILQLPEPTTERSAIQIADADKVNPGDTIYSLGFPDYGMNGSMNYDKSDIVVTKGIVSKRTKQTWLTDEMVDMFYQDVQISHGNSGGPTINERGAVIGIASGANSVGGNTIYLSVSSAELVKALDSAGVKYQMEGEGGGGLPVFVIIIIAAAVVVIAVIIIIVLVNKKKPVGAPVAAAYGNNPGMGAPGMGAPAMGSPAMGAPAMGGAPYGAPAPMGAANNSGAAIVGVSGNFKGSTFVINGRLVIGRNPEKCSVCFPVDTRGVSGVHCEIRMNGQTAELIDCGSSNGTFIGNGQRIQPNMPVPLANGTYFYLGSSEQMFQFKMV